MKTVDTIKAFFGTPEKPVTNSELLDFRRTDKDGYDEVVTLVKATLAASDVGAVEMAV